MRRRCLFILLFLMMMTMSSTIVDAANKKYMLPDLGMSIEFPSVYVVFTRDIADNDPNLSAYGLNKKDLLNMMKSKNIYLNAWDETASFEIIVTMIPSTINDFNLMSDTTLNALAASLKSEYAKSGITVDKYEVYKHDQAKFIKVYSAQPNGNAIDYVLQYYTVYDYKAINVTLRSYSGEIDSKTEAIIRPVVKSVHFEKEPLSTEVTPDTAAFVFKDKDTGVKFTVPANWTQESLSKPRQYIDAKFSSKKEPALSILYGSSDIWAEMTSTEKKEISRVDIDNSFFTKEDFAKIMNAESSKVSKVSYGGKEYYLYVNTTSGSSYGIDIEVTISNLVRVENGYLYMFQFSGNSQNAYYTDFEKLIESVKYPAAEEKTSEVPTNNDMNNMLLGLLISMAVCIIPVIVYRFGIVKHPEEKTRAKRITIIYGLIAFILAAFIIYVIDGIIAASASTILWSFINYHLLSKGTHKNADANTKQNDPCEEIHNTVANTDNFFFKS